MNKFFRAFFSFFLFNHCYGSFDENILLQAPKHIDVQECMNFLQNQTYAMTWNKDYQCWKSCLYHQGQYALSICYVQLPDDLTQEEKSLFKTIEQNGRQYYLYQVVQDSIKINDLLVYEDDNDQDQSEYYLAKPREFSGQQPEIISYDQLLDCIKTKKVLFYTGAGISMGADIYCMHELQKNLGLQSRLFVDDFVKNILHEPEVVLKVVTEFFQSLLDKQPTLAHCAIKNLAQYLKTSVFTENLDVLHEKTGIAPLRVSSLFFKENISDIWAQDVDMVICCGLSYDDRGFLAWYKHHNAQGRIIAVDIKQPSYLDDSDGILYGDIQEVLPQLWQYLQHELF